LRSPPKKNPVKRPKIQTKALATPKGKSQLRLGEAGGGSRDVLIRSRFDLGIPEDILKLAPSQPDGVYQALAAKMAEDGDWVDGLWNIRGRLVLVSIYGARDLGRSEGKAPPRIHVLDAYKRVGKGEFPDWDSWDEEHLPVLEEIAMPMPGRSRCLNKSWALMTLPEGLSSGSFLCPENCYSSRRGGPHGAISGISLGTSWNSSIPNLQHPVHSDRYKDGWMQRWLR